MNEIIPDGRPSFEPNAINPLALLFPALITLSSPRKKKICMLSKRAIHDYQGKRKFFTQLKRKPGFRALEAGTSSLGARLQVPVTRYQSPGHRTQLPVTGNGINSYQHGTVTPIKLWLPPPLFQNRVGGERQNYRPPSSHGTVLTGHVHGSS